jgi:hypothetical protein
MGKVATLIFLSTKRVEASRKETDTIVSSPRFNNLWIGCEAFTIILIGKI